MIAAVAIGMLFGVVAAVFALIHGEGILIAVALYSICGASGLLLWALAAFFLAKLAEARTRFGLDSAKTRPDAR